MLDLVGNLEDWLAHDVAQIMFSGYHGLCTKTLTQLLVGMFLLHWE